MIKKLLNIATVVERAKYIYNINITDWNESNRVNKNKNMKDK